MDPVTIAATVAKTATTAWDVGTAIYELVRSTQKVDDTVKNLASEVTQLGDVCDAIRGQLEKLAKPNVGQSALASELGEREMAQLATAIEVRLVECDRAMNKLNDAISNVRRKRSNFLTQTWRQLSLNMNKEEIAESRTQIRAHTTNLQISLQLIILKAVYLAPRFADQGLLTMMAKLDLTIKNHGRKVDSALFQSAKDMLSTGTSLYEASVTNGSVISDSTGLEKSRRTFEWLERCASLQEDTSPSEYSAAESRLTSTFLGEENMRTDFPATSSQPFQYDEDDQDESSDDLQDDFALETAQAVLANGTKTFLEAEYHSADLDLQEAFNLFQALPTKLRRTCDLPDLQYKLAVCAFHIHDTTTAELALVSVVEQQSECATQALNSCHAGHLLAQVYVKQGKLGLALASCDNAYLGRRKLLGKDNLACYESLALASRILGLQNQRSRSKALINMIPRDVQNSVCCSFRDLPA
ncbi:hypothetical protein MBLNU459_g6227t1 [Dothideomycetes sp. NU459]